MILILSKESDFTTEDVMDWIKHSGGSCFRLNGEDVLTDTDLVLNISNNSESLAISPLNAEVEAEDIKVVWYRRTIDDIAKHIKGMDDTSLENDLNKHLSQEYLAFYNSLNLSFSNVKWLNEYKRSKINKIESLLRAKKAGLKIPDTLIVNSKTELMKRLESNKEYITKPLGESTFFVYKNNLYPIYTEKVTAQDIDKLSERLFPSLVQEYIDKEFEIRIFFLDNVCHSMAIFSQMDEKTQTDFRHYNFRKPNRMVPYKLPKDIERCIRKFMKLSSLDCGSLDMIKSRKGDYVFLEVNSIGQFGMVSYPCNYYLEEKVAQHLIKLDQ